jgi:serine/threonine protein kinase
VAPSEINYIGSYRLLNVVHAGHASNIWVAFHDGLRKRFAVKVLVEKFRRNREQMTLLKREYAVGRAMDHPRVIKLIEQATFKAVPYLVMEYFAAPNMKIRIMDGAEKICHLWPKIVEQAAEGLAYFNEQGWVHRDVKPHNFLVNDDGEVKLIDFALARKAQTGLSKLFAMKAKVQGTRSYMSPEQIRGGTVDSRTDVYGFGCTIYELMTGKPPFTGTSANELLNKHLKAVAPSLEASSRNITPEFATLMRQTLAKKPAGRPESMQKFLEEFRKIEVFKEPPTPPEEGEKGVR